MSIEFGGVEIVMGGDDFEGGGAGKYITIVVSGCYGIGSVCAGGNDLDGVGRVNRYAAGCYGNDDGLGCGACCGEGCGLSVADFSVFVFYGNDAVGAELIGWFARATVYEAKPKAGMFLGGCVRVCVIGNKF